MLSTIAALMLAAAPAPTAPPPPGPTKLTAAECTTIKAAFAKFDAQLAATKTTVGEASQLLPAWTDLHKTVQEHCP